jgi:hypothetical protein
MKSISVLGEEEVAIAAREKAALISTGDDVLIQAKGNVHLNPFESKKRMDRAARIDGAIPDGVRRCDVCGEELVEGDTGAVCVNAAKLEYGSE